MAISAKSSVDARPRLAPGVVIVRSSRPDIFSCRDPRSGKTFSIRKLDAVVAHSCDGARTLSQVCEVVQKHGFTASTEMVADLVRRLRSMGILEDETAPGRPGGDDEAIDLGSLSNPAIPAVPLDLEPSRVHRAPVAPPPQPPASAEVPSDLKARLAALESLSLDKGAPATPAPSPSSKLPWIIAGLALVVAAVVAWRFVGGPEESTEGPKFRVEVARYESRKGQTLVAAGYIVAPRLVQVAPVVGGQVKELLVINGAKVKKNEIVLRLDDSQIQAELRKARASLSSAQRKYGNVKRLYKAESATMIDLDAARSEVEIAAAEVGVIKQKLEQTTVRAPLDGTVIEVTVHEGEMVKGGDSETPALKIADLTLLQAESHVNESDAPLVRLGQRAEVAADGVPGKTFPAAVSLVSQEVDRARGTVKVKVELEETDEKMRPGMSARVTFLSGDDAPKRMILPRSALVGGSVWVVTENGTATSRPVTYQALGPSTVEISSGLKEGERVVVDGASAVTEGMQISPR